MKAKTNACGRNQGKLLTYWGGGGGRSGNKVPVSDILRPQVHKRNSSACTIIKPSSLLLSIFSSKLPYLHRPVRGPHWKHAAFCPLSSRTGKLPGKTIFRPTHWKQEKPTAVWSLTLSWLLFIMVPTCWIWALPLSNTEMTDAVCLTTPLELKLQVHRIFKNLYQIFRSGLVFRPSPTLFSLIQVSRSYKEQLFQTPITQNQENIWFL